MSSEIVPIDLGRVNCYLVKTDRGFLLFDSGGRTAMDKTILASREPLERALERAGCVPGKLLLIVLTHGDGDHTGNAAYLRDKYGAKIAMHAADVGKVENPDFNAYMKSAKIRSLAIRILFRFLILFLKEALWRRSSEFDRFTPDLPIDEGYDFSAYGFDAKVLHLPGHTEGSIAILTSSGDMIAGDILSNIGKPDIAGNGSDLGKLYASVERLKSLPIGIVYPGHGKPFAMEAFVARRIRMRS